MALEIDNFYIVVAEIMAKKLAAHACKSRGAVGSEQDQVAGFVFIIGQRQLAQQLIRGSGGRTCRVHNRDPVIKYRRKCVPEQRKMRASKDDTLRVACIIAKFRQVAQHDRLGDRAIIPAFLRKGNEQLTGEFGHSRVSIQAQQGLPIRAQPNGCLSGEDKVSPTRPGRHRGGCPWRHNSDDRQWVHLLAKRLQRDRGSRITCHDQQLDVALLQQASPRAAL